VFLEFLCVRYVILFSYCVGKISFTNLKHREVHVVIVPLPRVFWILFEDVGGFSSGLDMRTDVQYSVPERLLTKLFPVPWGVTTIVSNTSAYRNQNPNTHYTKHLRAGQHPCDSVSILCIYLLLKFHVDAWCLKWAATALATRYGTDGPGTESRWGGGGGAIITVPVQTGPGAYPASYTMCTGSLPRVKRPGRGVDHPPHLAPRLKEE